MINLFVGEAVLSKIARILIVEDERVVARDIRSCLESLGYSVLAIAISGSEAIEKAAELRPDIILMDIRLKGDIDGIDAARKIWKEMQIPIIYSTGYSDRNTLERAKETAPFGYILKPVEERELYVAIETALQRYQLDAELKRREQWLTTILRGIADGVIVVDTQKRIKFLNWAAEELLGYRQEEANDQDLTTIFQIVDEQTRLPVEDAIAFVLENGAIVNLREQILLMIRNGIPIPIAGSIASFRDKNNIVSGAVLVFRDITERRMAQERNAALERANQLEYQMTELQRIHEMKDDFLQMVSHELRTPLTNIKMAIQMVEITLDRQGLMNQELENSRLVQYIDILRNQCEQELSLVNDLLDMQRLNADAYQIDLINIDLYNWILQVTENFKGRAQNRQQHLQVNLPSELPPFVSDLSSMTRILSELLNNACKYTPPNQQITVTVETININQILFRICNQGVEISPEELTRIFDPFYRIPSSDRYNQGGTGLGLALVQKLVTRLGGFIQVESESGQTCFMISLPLQTNS